MEIAKIVKNVRRLQVDKKEYDQIEERANKLQNEAERKCSQKIKEAKEYKDGYVQGVEDLLTAIRRRGTK